MERLQTSFWDSVVLAPSGIMKLRMEETTLGKEISKGKHMAKELRSTKTAVSISANGEMINLSLLARTSSESTQKVVSQLDSKDFDEFYTE